MNELFVVAKVLIANGGQHSDTQCQNIALPSVQIGLEGSAGQEMMMMENTTTQTMSTMEQCMSTATNDAAMQNCIDVDARASVQVS